MRYFNASIITTKQIFAFNKFTGICDSKFTFAYLFVKSVDDISSFLNIEFVTKCYTGIYLYQLYYKNYIFLKRSKVYN